MENDQEVGFGSAIDQLVDEKGISRERVLETIEAALAAAFRKDYGEKGQDVRAEFNEEDGGARVYRVMTVVEDRNLKIRQHKYLYRKLSNKIRKLRLAKST